MSREGFRRCVRVAVRIASTADSSCPRAMSGILRDLKASLSPCVRTGRAVWGRSGLGDGVGSKDITLLRTYRLCGTTNSGAMFF